MTDKSAAAVRELAEKWAFTQCKDECGLLIDFDRTKAFISDLTALIVEHYVSKEEHEKAKELNVALKLDLDAAKIAIALIRMFILWTGENCQYYPDTNEWMYFESPMTQKYFKGTDELYQYWEENLK